MDKQNAGKCLKCRCSAWQFVVDLFEVCERIGSTTNSEIVRLVVRGGSLALGGKEDGVAVRLMIVNRRKGHRLSGHGGELTGDEQYHNGDVSHIR